MFFTSSFLVIALSAGASAYANNNLIKNNEKIYSYVQSNNETNIYTFSNNNLSNIQHNNYINCQNTQNSFSMNLYPENLYNKNINLYNKNIEKLDYMSELSDNWDGYNAKKFSKETLENTKKVLSNLICNQPNIFPTAESGVQMEFYLGVKYLQIVIIDNAVEYFQTDGENLDKDIYDEFEYNVDKIINIITAFFTAEESHN